MRWVADLTLDKTMLQDVLAKKFRKPSRATTPHVPRSASLAVDARVISGDQTEFL